MALIALGSYCGLSIYIKIIFGRRFVGENAGLLPTPTTSSDCGRSAAGLHVTSLKLRLQSLRTEASLHVVASYVAWKLIKCCTAVVPSILPATMLVRAYLRKIALLAVKQEQTNMVTFGN